MDDKNRQAGRNGQASTNRKTPEMYNFSLTEPGRREDIQSKTHDEIEPIILKLQTSKSPGPHDFTSEFCQTCEEKT